MSEMKCFCHVTDHVTGEQYEVKDAYARDRIVEVDSLAGDALAVAGEARDKANDADLSATLLRQEVAKVTGEVTDYVDREVGAMSDRVDALSGLEPRVEALEKKPTTDPSKLDKTDAGGADYGVVYAVDKSDNQTTIAFNPFAGANTLMYRDNYGRSKIADPQHEKDISNKGYVDGTVAGAVSIANGAVATANEAKGSADSALSTASSALSSASSAVTTANAAKSTADGIAGTANSALTKAESAVTTANTAKSTADGIADTANSALSIVSELKTDLLSGAFTPETAHRLSTLEINLRTYMGASSFTTGHYYLVETHPTYTISAGIYVMTLTADIGAPENFTYTGIVYIDLSTEEWYTFNCNGITGTICHGKADYKIDLHFIECPANTTIYSAKLYKII